MFNPKVFVAELIGTFALVFVGAAAGLYYVGLLGVALAHGLMLAVFAYAYGHVSGTHINPAVMLRSAANGNIIVKRSNRQARVLPYFCFVHL